MPSDAVDAYIRRSDQWPDEIARLRPILLGAGLSEEIKWAKPCYTYRGKNILILQEMKDFLALMFFKGALMEDPDGILEEQGPNSRSARRIRFTTVADVDRLAEAVGSYAREAIDIEDAGLEVAAARAPELVEELQSRLDDDPALAAAFSALTPGRQREYNLYFSGAKQSQTRRDRVERYEEKIRSGKGMRDR